MCKWLWKAREQAERDLEDEIQFHIAEEIRLRIEAGESPEDARSAAWRSFGNLALVKDVTRSMWRPRPFDELAQDVRLGIRLLGRSRLFAFFSILSLALGMGGATAVFTLYDAIVLRTLPVAAPERLVTIGIQGSGSWNAFIPYPQFDAMRARNRTLDRIFARTTFRQISVSQVGQTEVVSGLGVTGEYHRTLGVRPAVGRMLSPTDDQTSSAPVVVISNSYWHRAFGARREVVGELVRLNGVSFTVIGVEPAGFFGVSVGSAPDLTIPLHATGLLTGSEPSWEHPFGTWIEVMGRLRPTITIERASQELDWIFRSVGLEAAKALDPESADARFARDTHVLLASGARGGLSGLRDGYARGLRLLLLFLTAVLALASLNVAALQLSRSETRRAEIATRLALGARRGRIVRQLLTESGVIAICGALLGLLIAWQGSKLLLRIATKNAPVLPVDVAPDARAVAFIFVVCSASCLVFGLLPATQTAAAVRVSKGVLGRRGKRHLDRTIVVVQTALALVLVLVAGLFLRSLQQLWNQDTGYDRRNVLMFSVDAGLARMSGLDALKTYQRILGELRVLPGVRDVSVSTVRPVTDGYYLIGRVTNIGDQPSSSGQSVRVAINHLGPGYFQTMGVPLLAGRDFAWSDSPESPKVAIVSEQLARRFNGNPVGQMLHLGNNNIREVVGVARDTRYARITDEPRAVVYLPFFQQKNTYPPTFLLKHDGKAAERLLAASEVLARVDPALALFRAKSLELQTRESIARERILAWLTSYFGAFAWLLAGIGIYGLVACSVEQRTREFGLRMALGSRPSLIRTSVLGESAGTIAAGIAAGLAAAFGTTRFMSAQLYQVQPFDPSIVTVAVVTLVMLAWSAALIPAIRASRIDPMRALQHE